MKKVGFFIFILTLVLGASWYFVSENQKQPEVFENLVIETEELDPTDPFSEEDPEMVESEPTPEPLPQSVLYSVPFTSQSPTGEWGKSEFQNGCEEASVLMVRAWQNGETLTVQGAKAELLAMARFEEKQIGHGIDTDAKDTAEILLSDYAKISDYQVEYDFTLEELQLALLEGVVIVPANGQALKNPNFTRPGPLQHMLVIVGYDPDAKEFITNDPGTRKGEGYRYAEQVLFDAIQEYPTGKHVSIKNPRKAMIIIPEKLTP